ncbi:TPA: hypothetical protein N0F65_000185 [Lagenidium giganteum]|uniref:Uncharacterized protein n=1 Tax=Lagenidium giganteum TaxID=4803 RepID=A0AAV2YTQ4_9STRA|nr:TPA: hypothetical protein N0F65_000185 [Lagenidium giganteum]
MCLMFDACLAKYPIMGAVFAASSRHCGFPNIRFRCSKDPEQCPSHIRGRRRAQERTDAGNSCCNCVHQEARLRYVHLPTSKEALVGTSERAPSMNPWSDWCLQPATIVSASFRAASLC